MKTILYIALLLIFPVVIQAQKVSSFEHEKSAPFSYYKTSVNQLGFKDCPEAMAVTNGGIFSNTFVGIEFSFGNSLKPANKRVLTLEKDYLPIIQYELKEGNISYTLEAFSVTEDFRPENNLVTYVRWTLRNTGNKMEATKMGIKIIPLYNTGWKKFIRHNRYCTPWYRDQFMDNDLYENNQDEFAQNESGIFQGDHLVINCPNGFVQNERSDTLSPQWISELRLAAGETKELVFKLPVVPVKNTYKETITQIQEADAALIKEKLVSFWDEELYSVTKFQLPEQKIMNMFRTSYINLLNSKDLLADKKNTIQRCNEFQYDHFYVRDNAYFARVYDMLGKHNIAHNILQPYFIYDIEGKPIHFRQRTGIYKKLCHDYWGQVVWALGAHYRQTRNRELLVNVYELLPNHVKEFELAVSKDPRGLWPTSWPYDNEHIDGHYTGHSFWAILGLRYAIFMAEEMGQKDDAATWQEQLDQYVDNFNRELKKITDLTGGYIPPGMDNPGDGFDWANASAGLYPFEAIDKNDPIVRKTLEMVRNYNYMEGISTYSGCNALVAKDLVLNNKELPERGLHHYETFYVTTGNLVIGEQQKVIEDLYAILVHTSSTHGGFEWKPTPWANRDPGRNRQPHGWMAARYIELIRNMLVREEGNDIHLLSAVSPEWIREGESIKVDKAPTYFGEVSYTLNTGKNHFTVNLDTDWNNEIEKVYFHIPWFIQPESVTVDGKEVTLNGNHIELTRNVKNIKVSWKNRLPLELNFNKAVDIFLDKYHNRPNNANYVHLFPTLAAPGRKIDKSRNELALFSPDNYADVYFTTDGTEPDINSKKYKKPINLEGVSEVKAVCIDKDGEMSDIKIVKVN